MKVFGLVLMALAGLVAWLMWGPVAGFFLSLIPATAEYAWVGTIAVYVLVAWFGGVGLPVFLFIAGVCLLAGVWD